LISEEYSLILSHREIPVKSLWKLHYYTTKFKKFLEEMIIMKLKNKVAIITGGGRGIGRAVAFALAKEGTITVVVAEIKKEINKTAKDIRNSGFRSLAIKADVRFLKDIKNLVRKTVSKFGRIDMLVNNAGVIIAKHLEKTSEKEWDYVINVNLKGTFLCCKEVIPIMKKRKKGVIVNISSAGKAGYPKFSAYCASKLGVIGLTESLAEEVEKFGIKIYTIRPGAVDTRMQREINPTYHLRRHLMLKPEDVAEKVLKLCLPSCKIKSGSSIDVY